MIRLPRPHAWVLSSLAMFTLATPGLSAQSGRIPARGRNGMVVSSHYLASQAGRDILRHGGNAIDAAVATAFALAVTLPSAGNIGGGGFLVYAGANGKTTSFNFRERAPKAAKQTMYLGPDGEIKNDSNHEGILSVGVPGTVAGLWLAHQRLGKLPWGKLLQPAIKLAEVGWPSTWDMQDIQEYFKANAGQFPSSAKVFLKPGKELYKPGEMWKQPELAATLRRIQQNGRDGFYKGKTAQLVADFMRKNSGLITEADLASYEATEQPAVHGTYRGYDVYGMGPPSSGGIALIEMLNILEGYDLKAMGHNSAAYLHVLTEAMRRAFADRARYVGDPAFNPDLPVERLASKEYANSLRTKIDLAHASPSNPAKFNDAYESDETTHFSVVDAAGNAVSMTYTLEYGYGSRITVDGAGFLLNNEMGDFNPIPGRTDSTGLIGTAPNLVAPGKQMLSSMTPTILAKDGKPVLVVGSPGGRTIINTVLQVVLNVVDHGMTIGQAIEAGRIHHQWLPDVTMMERNLFSIDTRRLYEGMGHRIYVEGGQGSTMGIWIDWNKHLFYGAADTRAFDGKAVGW